MAKENNDGSWTEIDVSSKPTGGSLNNVEKVEFEVENTGTTATPSDTPKEVSAYTGSGGEKTATPNDDADADGAGADSPKSAGGDTEPVSETATGEKVDELDGINTKGAEKRIRHLVKQRKERDDLIERLNVDLNDARSKLITSYRTNKSFEISSLSAHENELNERVKSAEAVYLKAYDDGDKEKLLASQNLINDAKTDIKIVKARREQLQSAQQSDVAGRVMESEGGYAVPDRGQGNRQPPQQQPAIAAQPVPDKLVTDWVRNNQWFGKDEVATAVALAVDQKLKMEGYDPLSKEFYNEIDKRVRSELPHKFSQQANTANQQSTRTSMGSVNNPSQVVAGASRKSPPKTTVKLTQKDVQLAKKWGIPLDRYAAEKRKVEGQQSSETGASGYTNIDV